MTIALTGAISPVLGGSLADFFAGKSILWQVNLHGFLGIRMLKLFELQNFGFLFLIGGLLAIGALMLLNAVKEEGATLKEKAMSEIKTGIRYKLKMDETRKDDFCFIRYLPYTAATASPQEKPFGNKIVFPLTTHCRMGI